MSSSASRSPLSPAGPQSACPPAGIAEPPRDPHNAFVQKNLHVRWQRRHARPPLQIIGTREPSQQRSVRRRARRVSGALARLPALPREAVVLFELEDFPVEEIAVLQRASVPAVKSRIARGREKLRRFYERLGFHEEGAGPVRRKRKPATGTAARGDSARPTWHATECLPPLETNDG